MPKHNIPIYDISSEEFEQLRKHLNHSKLTPEAMNYIRDLYGLTPKAPGCVVRVGCDEYHGHSFKCLDFGNKESAVVLRLLNEIERQREILEDVVKQASDK